MFLHTRDAGALVSRCQQCGHVIRARMDRDVFAEQRAHSWLSCQQRRAETTRVVDLVEEPVTPDDVPRCRNGHPRAGNTSVNVKVTVCLACQRERSAASMKRLREARVSQAMATVLGVSRETMEGQRRTAQRANDWTVLSPPDRSKRQEDA